MIRTVLYVQFLAQPRALSIGFVLPGNNVLHHAQGEFGGMQLPETDLTI